MPDTSLCIHTKNCEKQCLSNESCKYLCQQVGVNRKLGKALLKRIYKMSGVTESLDYYMYQAGVYSGTPGDMIKYLRGLTDQELKKFIIMAKISGGGGNG